MSLPEHDPRTASLIATEFPQDPVLYYLNHAAVSPWPARTVEAVRRFAEDNLRHGSRHYPTWLGVEQRLRERLARLIGAGSPRDIALCKNTSEALSMVAFGLAWRAGDEVIISTTEFPSNVIVWEALAQRFGIHVIRVNLAAGGSPEAQVLQAVTPRTRLVSLSSVQYGTGLRLDTHALGPALARQGVLFCVDAIQSVGACPIDVQRDAIDFLMADGHKWMLGPEGLGVFYVNPRHIETLQLQEYGWHMVRHRGNYDLKTWEPADDATRFECGSPNLLGAHALDASLSLLEAVGLDHVEAAILARTAFLRERLCSLPGVSCLTDARPGRSLGILTIQMANQDPRELVAHLNAAGVTCANRGGGVRFSPHFYTSERTLEMCCKMLTDRLKVR